MEIVEAKHVPASAGPPEWFTGAVWLERVLEPTDSARLRATRVYFSPGARTAWHTHATGQTLHVTAGIARVQAEGGPICELRPGDTVTFEPGERHWHGATADRPMVHLALQHAEPGAPAADWQEHVSDEHYGG
jgi:quercetin dioxygenase-like cupin family protein